MMDIKKQIIECIDDEPHFAGYNNQERIRNKAKLMLKARKYSSLKRYATQLTTGILKSHNKGNMLMPSLDKLHITEVSMLYGSKGFQRLHYMHQPYVFLLGLLIYHNCATVQRCILNEMEETTKCIADNANRYSGGDRYEEFLYRWRLASLIHDIGYGISLLDDNKTAVDYLNNIFSPYKISFQKVIDLIICQTKQGTIDLIKDLDRHGTVHLAEYIKTQFEYPQHGAIYDHGIVSALMLLQLINAELLRKHPKKNNTIWDRDIIMPSINNVALAVAYHNLDKNEQMFKNSCDKKLCNLKDNALAWLLKLSDTLQEWDKPKVIEYDKNSPLPKSRISIRFGDNSITICNLPEPVKMRESIEKFIEPDPIRIIIENY